MTLNPARGMARRRAMSNLLRETAEPSAAVRVKRRPRVWFIGAGVIIGVIWALIRDAGATASGVTVLACAFIGAIVGAWARRDRCSACGASLPVRVFDESC